jgi:hypothetical protein
MKIQESHFEHYLNSYNNKPLHPSLSKIYDKFPEKIADLKNIIFYGPKGVGKYTQMLASIKKYSPSDLKYEKRLTVNYNKNIYFFKISDIHYEVDMSLIGCHSKLLWNDIYNQITDILLSRSCKSGIIVCKYFHEIHSELLDIFYSYMQTLNTKNIDIKYIFITESVSFIPDNIINCCYTIKVERPTKQKYNSCLGIKLGKNVNVEDIINITACQLDTQLNTKNPNENICNKIIDEIININLLPNTSSINVNLNNNPLYTIREYLYDIFIYNLNPQDCIWFIVNKLILLNKINNSNINEILIKTYTFLQYYNNNYRPIYHFEHFIIFLIIHIYDIKEIKIDNDKISKYSTI